MATLDRRFVDGLFWRMLVLGAALAVVLAVFISLRMGYSVALGAALGAVSLRVTVFAVLRMFGAVIKENARGAGWGIVLALKLVLLFFAVWICLAKLDVEAVSFVLGYKLIFPALVWQAFARPGLIEESGDDADDNESS